MAAAEVPFSGSNGIQDGQLRRPDFTENKNRG
jgi:hypothetical protein